MSPTSEATLILAVLLSLSLIASYITFRLLKSTAMITSQGVRLGGAAAMLILTFLLLNRYLPRIRQGLVEEAAAAQSVKGSTPAGIADIGRVVLSPSDQAISELDFRHIDRNTYYVDESLHIAIRRPESAGWEAGLSDSFQVIGVQDIPFFGAGLTAMRTIGGTQTARVFGVRAQSPHEVVLERSSTISSVSVATNPFEDEEYVRRSIAAFGQTMNEFGQGPTEDISPDALRKAQAVMVEQFNRKLAQLLPLKREIRNGVFAVPMTKDMLRASLFSRLLPESSLLDQALMYGSTTGLLSQPSVHNVTIDQSKALASFNGSVRLGQVRIDGRVTDAVLNNIGFIVAGDERAVWVELVYMSVDDVDVFRTLQRLLESLRFTA